MLHLQSISFRFVRNVRWASSSSYSVRNLPSVTLYQYNICPFCHKTKAFLGFVGIRPSIIEVNPLTRSELPSGTYRKVPIAILDDTTQVNGSDDIVSALMKHPSIQERWKDHALFQVHDDTWVSFANDELAALIYPNLCRTLRESYQAFGYVDDVTAFSNIQKMMIRTLGSLAMYMAASRVKSKSEMS
jgi:microsomal prostaglandin-E synthase 2